MYHGTVPASPARSGTHCSGSQATWQCDSGSPRVALVTSHRKELVQVVIAGSQIVSDLLTPVAEFLGRSTLRASSRGNLVVPRQSFFCRCITSVEQAADRNKTAAFDGLVSSWTENISVRFCLRASGYGLALWYALGLLVVSAIQVHQLQLQLMQAYSYFILFYLLIYLFIYYYAKWQSDIQ